MPRYSAGDAHSVSGAMCPFSRDEIEWLLVLVNERGPRKNEESTTRVLTWNKDSKGFKMLFVIMRFQSFLWQEDIPVKTSSSSPYTVIFL